jgi:molybdenum cofactor cytidylyltransferase
LVQHAVATVRAAGIATIIVVVGHQAPAVRAALVDAAVQFCENPDYAAGQGTSVACGARAAQQLQAQRVLFVTCDQPLLRPEHIQRLLDAPPAPLNMLRVDGKPTQPSLWDAATVPLLAGLSGDHGGRQLITAGRVTPTYLDIAAPELLFDIDTPEDYTTLCAL